MNLIGIDIGTTTISAAVLDSDSRQVIESRTISNNSFISSTFPWERIQNVSIIIEKAAAVLDQLLTLYPDISSIGLTGQMHGIVYIGENGQAVSPLYTWQDGRSNQPVTENQNAVEIIKSVTGLTISSGYGLATHYYNIRHGLVPEGSTSICTIADYLGMVLTGRKTPLVHISNAASLGLFDSQHGCFYSEQIQELHMNPCILPEVTSEFALLGAYKGIPVAVAIGDNQASFLGSAGMEESTILLNMGTGGQISVFSTQYFEAPGIECRPLTKDRYLLVGASLCGGRAYAIVERFFRSYLSAAGMEEQSQYQIMEVLARKGRKSERPWSVTTTFSGTRQDPEQCGSICGITEDNFTPENLIYGTLKGMAQELYDMYQIIYDGTGIRPLKLIGSGNGLRRNKVLQEIFKELFQAEFTLSECEEEAASGAALSSLYGIAG